MKQEHKDSKLEANLREVELDLDAAWDAFMETESPVFREVLKSEIINCKDMRRKLRQQAKLPRFPIGYTTQSHFSKS